MIKWVAAFVGYYLFRFPGAMLGFFIGGMIDQFNSGKRSVFQTRFSVTQSGSLQLNLLALAATVIKADGVVKAQELQFVRNFFITNYGKEQASMIFETFNEQIKNVTLANEFHKECGIQIHVPNLLHFAPLFSFVR